MFSIFIDAHHYPRVLEMPRIPFFYPPFVNYSYFDFYPVLLAPLQRDHYTIGFDK
ncbi:hypothetical protein MOOR_28560 [Moorella thermoacetica]|uniref:Uncharacterized protein n=1 Tax=Neomoorella thermoacetica TaxID=1525 RepID=A0A1J5JFE6_NEOTH|nr:hypothetical protein MOOR_28560 [Moorella thermoacetica]